MPRTTSASCSWTRSARPVTIEKQRQARGGAALVRGARGDRADEARVAAGGGRRKGLPSWTRVEVLELTDELFEQIKRGEPVSARRADRLTRGAAVSVSAPRAAHDLRGIRQWIATDSGGARARRSSTVCVDTVRPARRAPADGPSPARRWAGRSESFAVQPYVVFYRVRGERIEVVRVIAWRAAIWSGVCARADRTAVDKSCVDTDDRPRPHPQLRHRGAHRPRQVDARRSADRALRRARGARDDLAGAGFDGHRARARDHDQGADRPAQIHRRDGQDYIVPPDRHARPRRLLLRGQPVDARLRGGAAAGRRDPRASRRRPWPTPTRRSTPISRSCRCSTRSTCRRPSPTGSSSRSRTSSASMPRTR